MPARKLATLEDKLADAAKMRFRAVQYASMDNPRYGIMHISDMVTPCKRKVVYNKMKNADHPPMGTDGLGIVYDGEGVHRMNDRTSKAYPELKSTGEIPFGYDFINEKEVNIQQFQEKMKSDKPYTVVEALDFVFGETDGLYEDLEFEYDGEMHKETTFIDYKTWKSKGFKQSAMKEEHYLQLSGYAGILNKLGATSTQYVTVINLDVEDRFAKPLVFTKKLMSYDKVKAHLVSDREEYLNFLESGRLPPRKVSYLCDGYCDHVKRCSEEEIIAKVKDRELEIKY